MKIGYLIQENVPDIRKKPLSGPANHVVCVINELKRSGHQVVLLARLDSKIYTSDDLEKFIPVDVPLMDKGAIRLLERIIRRIQYSLGLPYANLFESVRFALACRKILSGYDMYFERMGWLGYGGGLASHWYHVPLIVEVNGDPLDEFVSQGLQIKKSQQKLSDFLMKKAAWRTTHVIATGEGWRQKYIERWSVDSSRVSVVENGSTLVDLIQRQDTNAFNPPVAGEPLRVAYCGGFEPWHGIPVLITAVKQAVDQGCDIQVTLIGSGPEKDTILKRIRELDLENRVTLTGYLSLEETARHLAKADIGVSPYCGRVEYSGLKLLDYKAAGLATIASGDGRQPEVIAHSCTGFIVPPCDEEALAKAIVELSNNLQLVKSMGQRARMEAEQFHGWKHTVEEIEKLMNSILTAKTH